MAFLIVVGLFLSYEMLYNHIIDRERTTNGTWYMMIHIFLIFALNNISVALEFMREEEIALTPKTLFLTFSFVLYFVFLFLLGLFAKKRCGFKRGFVLVLAAIAVGFIVLMLVLREMMFVNIALSVVFVFGICLLLYEFSRKMNNVES